MFELAPNDDLTKKRCVALVRRKVCLLLKHLECDVSIVPLGAVHLSKGATGQRCWIIAFDVGQVVRTGKGAQLSGAAKQETAGGMVMNA